MEKAFGPDQRKAFRDKYLAAFGVTALLLCSFFGQAQIFSKPNGYGSGFHRVDPDSTLYFPTGCGVPTDSTFLFSQGFGQGEKKKRFAIYGDSCGHLVYYWDPSAQAWSVFGSGGGSGADSSGIHAFYTLYRSDTSRANIYGAIALRLIKGDTSYANFLMTRAWGYKISDSIFAVINAALAGKQATGSYITAGTGDVAFSGPGSAITTIQPHVVSNSKAAQMPARTVKSNLTGSTADQADNNIDSLASHITPDSFRIYRKPGSDSVFACITPVATGIEKCVFQYHDSVGTGGGGGSDSGIAVRNGILKTIAAGTIYLESDSSKYSTVYTMTKIRDSLGNIIGTKAGKMLRWFNAVELHHADSSFAVDAADSIQATINDAFNSGGGVVYLPAGHYKASRPLRTSIPGSTANPNSQIYIPLTNLRGTNAITIQLMGERPPSFEKSIVTTGYVPPKKGYTIIESTIVGSGTYPSVIGTDDTIFSGQHWNATEVDVQNIIVRTNTKGVGGADTAGSMCGINFLNLTGCSMENVVVDVTSEAFTSVMPGVGSTGILLPHANNSAWNYLSRIQVQGYFVNINMNEHTYADYLFLAASDTAIQLDDMNHDIHIDRVLFNGVVHAIHASNNAYIVVDNFDTEHMLSSCRNVWYTFKDDISSETTSGLWGTIKYHSVRSCGSAHPEDFTVVNKGTPSLELPNLAYGAIYSSPLPWQTVIGNGIPTTNAVFHQPKSAGIEINSKRGADAELMFVANSDSTNQYYALGVINGKNSKAPFTSVGTKYSGPNSVQFVDKFLRPSDTASVTTLTKDAYEFKLGVPLYGQTWTAATRQTLGLANGAHGINSDSGYVFETLVGATWYPYATRDWVRTNYSGASFITSLTTTGTTGAASVTGGVLNIPQYAGGSGSVPPNSGIGFPIYRPQIPEFFGLGCVGCTLDTTSTLHRITINVPAVSGFQSVLTNNPALTVSNYITGNTKTLTLMSFDSIGTNANYLYTNATFNINAAVPTMKYNSSPGVNYGSYSISAVSAEARDYLTSGSWFHTWYTNNAERMRLNAAGNMLFGTIADSLAFVQIGQSTAAKAQIFLTPSASGPNSTNNKNGQLYYDTVANVLNFRHAGAWFNILGSKQNNDSVGSNGFTTNGHLYKVRDSLDALYKRKADSVGSQGYTTIANKNKLADSLMGAINAFVSAGQILPTATALTNIASVTSDSSSYTKVGNTITFKIAGQAVATASGYASFTVTVPITNITWNTEYGGSGAWYDLTAGSHNTLMAYFSSATTIAVTGTYPTTNTGKYVLIIQYDAR